MMHCRTELFRRFVDVDGRHWLVLADHGTQVEALPLYERAGEPTEMVGKHRIAHWKEPHNA